MMTPRARRWLRHLPLLVILLVAGLGALTLGDDLSFDSLRENRAVLLEFRDHNFAGMALSFIAVYVLIVAFSLPGAAVASMTGGFLFGLALGAVFNVMSATLGAAAIFLVARWGPGAALSARMEASDGRLKRLREGLRAHEVNVLLLLRLMPVVPFFVANLLPALVGVRFWNFLWTTALGIVPGAIVFTWIGVGLGEVFARGESPDLSLIREPYILGPILGLCVLAALPIVIKTLRGGKEV